MSNECGNEGFDIGYDAVIEEEFCGLKEALNLYTEGKIAVENIRDGVMEMEKQLEEYFLDRDKMFSHNTMLLHHLHLFP